jgi:hypothetical protein
MAVWRLRKAATAALLTDVEVDYSVADAIKLSAGGRNVFNRLPESAPYTPTGGLVNAVRAC